MKHNENPDLKVFATDYSYQAVDVVKANPMYPVPEHGKGRIHASVWDITSKPESTSGDLAEGVEKLSVSEDKTPSPSVFQLPEGVEPGSVDVLTVIYVLSALHPKEWEQAIHNLYTVSFFIEVTTDGRPSNQEDSSCFGTTVVMTWPKYASRRTDCSTLQSHTSTSVEMALGYTFSKKSSWNKCLFALPAPVRRQRQHLKRANLMSPRPPKGCLRWSNWARTDV